MGDVDFQARRTAYKVMLPMAIVISLLLHYGLADKIFRRTGRGYRSLLKVASCPRGPRDMILLSLMIGNIIVSVFPLVILAMVIYDDSLFQDTCKPYLVSDSYRQSVMPAVNAVGLVLLVAEGVYFRQRVYQEATRARYQASTITISQTIASIIAGAVPWGYGILLILPLTVSNYDFDSCTVNLATDAGRNQAQVVIWFSLILPCSFAVFVAVGNLLLSRCLPTNLSRNGPLAEPASSLPPGSTTYSPSGQVNMIPDKPSLSEYISPNEQALAFVAAVGLLICCVPFGFFQSFYVLNENPLRLGRVFYYTLTDILFWLVTLSSCVISTVWIVGGSFRHSQN